MNKIRSANLRLLRHGVFHTDQTHFAETVNISQSKLSELEREKTPLDDSFAQRIEKAFSLPAGWMDRDNSDFFLTSQEYTLVKHIRDLPLGQQNVVISIFDGILQLTQKK